MGIVTATDAGDVDGWHYLVMEYLDGLNLAEIIERVGKIDTSVAASIMRDVCQALACAHQAGLVHRDIKPSNIMLTHEESVSSPARQVDASVPEKLVKGNPLEEWADLMLVERDVDTLGEAMTAIAMLADAHDVSEAQSILIAARRFGGWAASAEGDPAQRFMSQLVEKNADYLLPRPGIEAITRELDEGNENSWAASLFLLNSFNGGLGSISKLSTWASEPDNRRPATELHRELKDLLRSGKLKDDLSLLAAKGFSLLLAMALDAPLQGRARVTQRYRATRSSRICDQRE